MNASLSQHPEPDFSVLHVSDTHLLGGGRKLHGSIDTASRIDQMFQRLVASSLRIKALVFTGDLADCAEPEAYRELRALVEPYAHKLGAQVVWVMGNHDEPEPFSQELFDVPSLNAPQDRVYDVDGLRIIALDTSVAGYHHGELTHEQLIWLRNELRTPAPRGTLIAMHHPPIPTLIRLMGVIELDDQEALWDVISGSDVRGILAGHLHYSTLTVKNTIPVSVAAAMCYNIDLAAPADRLLVGVDRAHGSSLVSVYPEQLVMSDIPAIDMPELFGQLAEHLEALQHMPKQQLRAMFSAKDSDYNKQVDAQQAGQ